MAGDGQDDAEEVRHRPPYSSHHPIPTIKKFREEKEARKADARDHGGQANGDDINRGHSVTASHGNNDDEAQQQQEDAGAQDDRQETGDRADDESKQEDNVQPAVDTSETEVTADPRARVKKLKKRKDERAEREVTDPVTHLPVTIHDLTSAALKEVPENEETSDAKATTVTGTNNKRKSAKQLQDEQRDIQDGHDSLRSMFPPPALDTLKEELASINKLAITVGLTGAAAVLAIAAGLEKLVNFYRLAYAVTEQEPLRFLLALAIWFNLAFVTVAAITVLILGVRGWMTKRIDAVWEGEVWAANEQSVQQEAKAHETETVAWLNSFLGSVWPLVNPDLFTSLADTLEDVMQASLPKMVQMVSVNDIGQGSQNIRILGVRWLPTGAATQSVSEDGQLAGGDHSNDRKVPGEGEVENTDDQKKQNGTDQKNGQGGDQTQQGDDGSQQQIAEGLEAEEGDFVNMEVSFAYRARSSKESLKDRAQDMHLYIAFYLPGNVKVPVWVDLRGIIGIMRLRLQLCPDPPFVSLCTLTFLGQPKVDISCTPLFRHALNIMDVPLISNFVQSAVDAAMAEYVAPKSLNLDLKDMLSGDDFKKDTSARGVLVINIKRGYDFKIGDTGIPLVRDGSSDPYVSVGWAKFGKPVWSTRLILKEMEPWWDETAYILVTPQELNVDERLRIQLWDSDRFTADDDLGRIEIALKDLMKREESNGYMWHRTDGFRALKAGESMPGKLEWSVGYFSKARLQNCQLQKQTFDHELRSHDQLKKKVDETCERKLREANIKQGRHKSDADELEQQKAQEFKSMEDSIMISSPPPDHYPSGILSIQIHQITGLELQKLNKARTDKGGESDDEQEEGEGLPSAYCSVIINHRKVFKTRTKPKNSKPFYNASTERFIPDWQSAEVYVSVRDGRVKEDDPLLGIVHLPLGEVFKERAQINGFYPLTGGVGYGRIRISMVWRSVQYLGRPEALGWSYGTVDIQSSVAQSDVPEDLRRLKLKFYTDLGSGKMYTGRHDDAWTTKKGQNLKLPVHKRYSSCLAVQFKNDGIIHDKVPAFAVFWLKDIPDEEGRELTLPVWKGDYERAIINSLPEAGERIGSITLKLTFWNGLGAAHSKWAQKDPNVREVTEVLETARDNYEEMQHEKEAGVVDGDATDSSSESDSSADDGSESQVDGGGDVKNRGPMSRLKDFKKHEDVLNRQNKGLMQWKVPRTAQWAAHKAERAESKFTGMFKHHTRQPGVETEV